MYEASYNKDLAKKLVKTNEPGALLDKELSIMRSRALELDAARRKMSDGYKQVLEGLSDAFKGVDLQDPNLLDTHNRMARSLIEVCSGLGTSNDEVFSTTFPADNYDEVIILKNIDFNSLCSHHFFPFTGKAHVGYLPNTKAGSDSKVVGLSKLARIVDAHAQRPQLQERLCSSIKDAIDTQLRPAGVMVVIEAEHGCLTCRGAKKANASMVTSSLSGAFKSSSKLRQEFLDLIKN